MLQPRSGATYSPLLKQRSLQHRHSLLKRAARVYATTEVSVFRQCSLHAVVSTFPSLYLSRPVSAESSVGKLQTRKHFTRYAHVRLFERSCSGHAVAYMVSERGAQIGLPVGDERQSRWLQVSVMTQSLLPQHFTETETFTMATTIHRRRR